MVRSRGESSATGDANLLPASLPDIGRSLQLAREQANLTLDGGGRAIRTPQQRRSRHSRAATSGRSMTGSRRSEVSGPTPTRWACPGTATCWSPSSNGPLGAPTPATNGDTAVVPVVSISSAPAGGHSPAGGRAIWTSEATGVADATTTGVFEPVTRPVLLSDNTSLSDTSQVPAIDTGQVAAVNLRTPRILKVLVGLVAFLIVVGGVALLEHENVNHWYHDARSTTAHWYDNAKVAVGITSKPKGHSSAPDRDHNPHDSSKPSSKTPSVKVVPDPSGQAATFNVSETSFTVKILADNAPCWVQAIEQGNPKPVFAQVLAGGPEPHLQSHEPHDDRDGQRGGAGLRLLRVSRCSRRTSRPKRRSP